MKMGKQKLLVLDFDGVIVDSAKEAALSCYVMLSSTNLEDLLSQICALIEDVPDNQDSNFQTSCTSTNLFIQRLSEFKQILGGKTHEINSLEFKHAFMDCFVPLRPIIEDACEIVFLSLLVSEAVLQNELKDEVIKEKFFTLRPFYTTSIRQLASDYLVSVRNLIIQKSEIDTLKAEYFSVLPLYPQVTELFSSVKVDFDMAICTKRDTELTRQIVRYHGIENCFVDIFGGEMGRKEEFFKNLNYQEITFVEDRVETLVRFAESSEAYLQKVKLIFVSWGYHTDADLEMLKKHEDKIKRISNITEIL